MGSMDKYCAIICTSNADCGTGTTCQAIPMDTSGTKICYAM